ncbi:peptidase S58 family protein [Roseobacter denitrificans]|uniref:Peptidase, T4 family, putative n=1 Tax=Roseobacter denitrificans (strain ATCC 33942 / OCh 114) TaxID=375451 RepID=Q16DV8_ROSDO|nr:P1 family peptidase [Roseobacter denitrificans]ABG29835.1 peptidase, T4 family, putative [Roseobacter denitrificans OCh 114]AVL53056.1 peptidase S58 family protein [Roseobacter denitrificans]SFG26152.1 D-aminopeptidase [Roseobacter denitrificans OCh 114]
MRPGPRNLITDVAGLRVGNAQDHKLKSGATVLTADAPFTASVHVMGGAPGTRETDLLAPDKSVASVDALVLSGGSAFGLEACTGVVDGLRAMGRGFAVGSAIVPIVPGAILFDLINGGVKDWSTNPYPALGRRALDTASDTFEIGTAGAGTGATTATLKGGLGSSSLVLDNGITVGALVAANPFGAVTTPGSRHFFAAPYEMGNEFAGLGPDPTKGHGLPVRTKVLHGTGAGANTTIAIVATDAALDKAQCQRMAIAAHDGMARAIVPSHTPMDGDLVFALSTGGKALADLDMIGHGAALCLTRAIARAVYAATPQPGDLLPSWHDLPIS